MQVLKFNPELATQVWPSQKQNLLDSDNDDKTLFQAVPGQIQSHLNGNVEESVLFKPFSKIESKSNFSQNEVDTLKADVKKVIESAIRPAFKKLLR